MDASAKPARDLFFASLDRSAQSPANPDDPTLGFQFRALSPNEDASSYSIVNISTPTFTAAIEDRKGAYRMINPDSGSCRWLADRYLDELRNRYSSEDLKCLRVEVVPILSAPNLPSTQPHATAIQVMVADHRCWMVPIVPASDGGAVVIHQDLLGELKRQDKHHIKMMEASSSFALGSLARRLSKVFSPAKKVTTVEGPVCKEATSKEVAPKEIWSITTSSKSHAHR